MDPCVNMTIAAAHGNTCCPPLICGANGVSTAKKKTPDKCDANE